VPSLAAAQPGDLVFFPGTDGTASAPGHVGIYIGNGQMIDAPYSGADVRVEAVGNPTAIRRVSGPSTSADDEQLSSASSLPTSTSGTYGTDFASAAASTGVPEALLNAVASTESSFEPSAVSSAGAEGLMQLMPSTAASLGVNPFDPNQAVTAAAQLLSNYHEQFGSWSLALAAYNAGPAAVQAYSGIPPYSQTQNYVQTVLSRAGMEGQ
jgi:membrane-bound lytic murein transglycosylase B